MKIKIFVLLILTLTVLLSACGKAPVQNKTGSSSSVVTTTATTTTSEVSSSYAVDPSLWGQSVSVSTLNGNFTSVDFTGKWNRTNTVMALSASIEIKNQKQHSFDFSFHGQSAANTGTTDGTATIVSTTEAKYSVYYMDGIETVTFELKNNTLTVTADPDSSLALGFGANVTIGGSYILGSPKYTNANIVNEVFKTPSIKARVQSLLGDDIYQNVIDVMKEGFEMDQSNSKVKLDYSGFINGAGLGADIKLDGDKIYVLFYDTGKNTLYTNDINYKNKLPDFFNDGRDLSNLSFVYKQV